MVASRPAKAAKHTYAERVLQAYSQVRKKHKRHPIHLATLRAQVKRNAEDQGDKLGPKWTGWIAKTVHRLENEGILAANSSGSITMTPNGKKAIVAARKSLSIPATSFTNAAQEEIIWKTVSHVSSTPQARGVKRPRYSTVQSTREYQHQDEDGLQSSPISHRSMRTKRARYSAPTGKKPVSQMTKSELKAALKTLETEHANLLMRAASPLTDLDGEEERERLRSELQARDEELERIRRQIDEMAVQTAPVGRHESDIDQPSISVHSRGASSSLSPERRRPSRGVVRTQSGSLIHDLSKQPTPAPSNNGEGWDSDTDPFAGDMEILGRFDNSASINGAERGRPVGAAPKKIYDTHLGAEISRLKTLMEDTKKVNDERQHVDSRKISELEMTLAARMSEIEAQKEQHTNLSEQFAELEKDLGDRNFRVLSLEREIEALHASLSSESSQLVSKDTELENIRISKDKLEASFTAQLHQLERTNEEAIAFLNAEKANCLEQVDAVRRDLQQAEEALTIYSKRITLSEDEATHLRAGLQHAQLELEQNRDKSMKLQQVLDKERRTHVADMSEKDEMLAQREAELTSLTQRLQESTSLRESLSEQWAAMETASQESIRALRSRISISEVTLAEHESKVAELTDILSQARSEGCGLREKIMSLESNVGNLQKELDTVTSSHADLEATYQLKCDECDDLLTRVQSAEHNITGLSETLTKATDDANFLRQHLEQVKASESAWRDSLRRAEASHEELVGSLSAEVKQLREKSSTMELEANSFKDNAAEKQLEITKLQQQLSVAQRDIQRAEEVRIAAEAQFSSERAAYEKNTSGMEESINRMQREVDDLSSQLISAQITFSDTQEKLNARTEELSDVRASLLSESQRVANLDSKLTAAVARASDAEERLLDLKSSKQADEKTINMLKETFAKLRDIQMQSLTELGNKVHSANATPVSKRRLTSNAA